MRFIVATILLCIGSVIWAQEDAYLSKFTLAVSGDDVVISWTTSADFRCEDLMVEHALDSVNFTSVYTYPGICGAEGKEEHYFYVFKNVVFNRKNYFRLNLGIYGVSTISHVHIIKRAGLNPVVTPNPANSNSRIHFSNNDRNTADILIFDIYGKSIGDPINTTSSSVQLTAFAHLVSGTYYYRITVNGVSTVGKFLYY